MRYVFVWISVKKRTLRDFWIRYGDKLQLRLKNWTTRGKRVWELSDSSKRYKCFRHHFFFRRTHQTIIHFWKIRFKAFVQIACKIDDIKLLLKRNFTKCYRYNCFSRRTRDTTMNSFHDIDYRQKYHRQFVKNRQKLMLIDNWGTPW